ncbi:3-deoxy-7-phosphoheptulonate synthase [Nonomuraea sp. NPDC050404]|uniref:3-deoxy-7-phosphoheptulonate synthase n=1 Tax=Nonomuraea sp. NPDC050404 TaxID=3155783 RepID=UPI00340A0DB7
MPSRNGAHVFETRPSEQQPLWADSLTGREVRRTLATAPPLVSPQEVAAAGRAVAAVAAGRALLLQAGDCAENLAECGPVHTAGKLAVLDRLAARMGEITGGPVVRVGRIAGQFAKPRSRPMEWHEGRELPAFRGQMINSPEPGAAARRHDARRMLLAHEASGRILSRLRLCRDLAEIASGSTLHGPWASHESLVLDYETPQVRIDPRTGLRYLSSTHYPWIGERTRRPDGAHVHLHASVSNPVGCKIGPSARPEAVRELCGILDPQREPGRLTLIARMGHAGVEEALGPIAAAVRAAGHPVVWVCDPMHGNTVVTASGRKTRHVAHIVAEGVAFARVLAGYGLRPGGLHLEVADTGVTECLGGGIGGEAELEARYTTLCDPRLNPRQALDVVEKVMPAWN